MDSPTVEISLKPRCIIAIVLVCCIVAEVSFVLFDAWLNYARGIDIVYVRRLFNITREDGLASWFGVTQTTLVALTAAAIWLLVRRIASWEVRAGWLALAVFFAYMSMDDGATIHERIGSTVKHLQQDTPAAGRFPSYEWQIVFLPAFAVVGTFMLVFLYAQFRTRLQRIALIAALGCMAFAVGLEFIEGLDRNHEWNVFARIADRFDFEAFTRAKFDASEFETLIHFSKSLEETLEMLAMTLLWAALLAQMMHLGRDVRLRVR